MRRNTQLLSALLLVVMVALFLAACGTQQAPTATPSPAPQATATSVPADAWQRIQQAGKMVVGVSADYPPFESYDDNFQLTGFDIALMQEIGKKLGVAVEFNDFAFDGLVGAIQLGQIDGAISAVSATPERQRYVDFSNVYYVGTDAILVSEDTTLPQLKTPEAMSTLSIGVQKGTVYEQYVQEQLVDTGLMPKTNLYVYTDIDQAIKDLRAGRITAVMLDLYPAQQFAATAGDLKIAARDLNPQRYAIALPKGQAALRRVINVALQELQNEGVVASLAKQYLDLEPQELVPVPTPSPEPPAPTLAPSEPTATPVPPPAGCIDGMAWVADLSYDDAGMSSPPTVQPGQQFVKGWRVRNSGTCTWTNSYFLGFVRGNTPAAQMGGQPVFVNGAVPPGATYDFQVTLTAPTTPGIYQGFWQMTNAQGVQFGETVWVTVEVPAMPTPTPVPPPPTQNISFTASASSIQQGQCVTISWSVTGAQAVYYFQDGQNWQNNPVPSQGSRQECPLQTTNYYLNAVFSNGQTQTRTLTVTVQPVVGAPVITQFDLDPPGPITVGQCSNVLWNVQGEVSRVTILRNSVALWDGAPVRGNVQDCPATAGTITYGIQATGPGGVSQAVRYLTVNPSTQPTPTAPPPPPAQPIIYGFTVQAAQIQQGQCVAVGWQTGGGTNITRVRRGGAIILDNGPLSGSVQDCPTQLGTVIYQLEAVGFDSSVFQEAGLDVQGP